MKDHRKDRRIRFVSFTLALGLVLFAGGGAAQAACGDGIVDMGEDCDQGGANGTATSCCTAGCLFRAASETCRSAAGPCDAVETCTGSSATCPTNAFAPSDTVCRAATEPCDVAEQCSGFTASCPSDSVADAGVSCRAASDVCDAEETCDGVSTSCPADLFASSFTVCRPASGSCDIAENCTGLAAACPADSFEADGTGCSDGQFCNGAETCQAGACEDAADPCASACDEGADACESLCGSEPAAGCLVDGGAVFLVKQNADPTRSKLKWKWGKGQPFVHALLGSPTTTTTYELCIYDSVGSTPQFLASLAVAPNGTWVDNDPKGFSYKDKSAAADGIRKIVLKPGVIDKTKANIDGIGSNLPVLTPASLSSLFAVEPAITVELVNSDGACWSSDFAINDVKTNTVVQFKAIAK